jgi:hypothetical protein
MRHAFDFGLNGLRRLSGKTAPVMLTGWTTSMASPAGRASALEAKERRPNKKTNVFCILPRCLDVDLGGLLDFLVGESALMK